ncbi:hypothetical protein ACVWW1_003203 [Bradyrhizobium sp. JR3.5]
MPISMAGPPSAVLARQFLDRGAASRLERRLQHQILRRIAGDEQFREHDEIGPVGFRLVARGACLRGVAGDVTDRRIELREGDLDLLFAHTVMLSRTRANFNGAPVMVRLQKSHHDRRSLVLSMI